MYSLPIFNAALVPCTVSPALLSPHEQGQFCRQCHRVVLDFSQASSPLADLAAARAAAPDGRVCGRFAATQVQRPPTLSQRLRWFVAALVLVVGQGLTAREAMAQVRRSGTAGPVLIDTRTAKGQGLLPPLINAAALPDSSAHYFVGMAVEEMPSFRGGGTREVIQYIQQRVVWPRSKGKIILTQGRVFASFTVGADGRVGDVKIVKHLHPLFDAEVLRVVRALPNFKPGRQLDRPVAVGLTVPVTFQLK